MSNEMGEADIMMRGGYWFHYECEYTKSWLGGKDIEHNYRCRRNTEHKL